MIFPPPNQISRIFLRSSWRSRCDLARRSTRHFRVIFGSFSGHSGPISVAVLGLASHGFGRENCWQFRVIFGSFSGHFRVILGHFCYHFWASSRMDLAEGIVGDLWASTFQGAMFSFHWSGRKSVSVSDDERKVKDKSVVTRLLSEDVHGVDSIINHCSLAFSHYLPSQYLLIWVEIFFSSFFFQGLFHSKLWINMKDSSRSSFLIAGRISVRLLCFSPPHSADRVTKSRQKLSMVAQSWHMSR